MKANCYMKGKTELVLKGDARYTSMTRVHCLVTTEKGVGVDSSLIRFSIPALTTLYPDPSLNGTFKVVFADSTILTNIVILQ